MAITVKHTKVSTIPDGDDTSLIRPSDWNADHQLVGTVPVANGGTGASTLTGYVKGNGTSTMTASATIPNTDVTGLGTMSTQNSNNINVIGGSISGVTVSGYIPTTEKAVANGVATLDGSGTVPISQLPSAVLGALSYQGTWNASTNTPTLTSSVGTKGYYYVVNVAGSTNLNGITDWKVGDWAVYNGTAWQKVDNTDAVTSVNGYTGTVVLGYADVGAFPATSTTGSGNVVLATGATQANPTINNYENFTPTTAPAYSEGRVWYDSTEKALAFYNDSSSLAVHVSQDLIFKVINNTGSTIPNGSPVYITGTSSGQTYPNVALAKADVAATSSVIGLTNGAIANGAIGYVSSQGTIDNVNTSTFTVGQVLYLSPYSAGQLMNTVPPTGITVQVGVATYIDSSAGHIYVKQTTPLAVPASIITGTLGVDHGGTGATTLTGYVKGSGTSAMTASATIPTTDLSGTVTNAQLANSTITINGTSTSLGGSISVGTVTSVTGTSPVISSGGNTPAISMPAATTSVSGYLTSTDWNTFNNKGSGTVTSVTATSPVTSTGGTTPVIAMPAATTSVNGYLTSTDWNTFNGKYSVGSALGTPSSATLTNATGLPVGGISATGTPSSTTYLRGDGAWATVSATTANNLAGGTLGSVPYQLLSGTTTFLAGNTTTTPQFLTSTGVAGIATAPTYTGSTGSGNVVLATSPTLVTPALGTPSALVGTNITGTASGLSIGGNAATATTAGNVSGTVAIANGGTGQTTRQNAMNTLAGSTTSGQYLRGNGTDVVMSAIQAADVPTLNQNTTGTASNVTGTVAVSNGGTGQTTYTNGQLLIGNTTGNTLTKATLTAGTGISVTNGSGSITIANTASAYAGPGGQVFSSNGTFTIPSGITQVKVTVIAGGGGGGGSSSSSAYTGGAGGGGGGAAVSYLTGLTPGNTLAVTIGAAGTAGAANGTGGTGGTSSVASGTQSISTISATGGAGGKCPNTSSGSPPPGGAGGIGSGGTMNLAGTPGQNNITPDQGSYPNQSTSGGGGASILGGGGAPVPQNGGNGNAGRSFGGGGSGAQFQGNSNTGGAGFAGAVIFEY